MPNKRDISAATLVIPSSSSGEERTIIVPNGESLSQGKGHMGLSGIWAQIGNMSAVVVLCGVAVFMIRDNAKTVDDELNARRQEASEERRFYQAEMKLQRETDEKRTASILLKLDSVTAEIRAASSEIRTARIAVQQAHPPQDECEPAPSPRSKE